jgi:S1-C subfamily serine protease
VAIYWKFKPPRMITIALITSLLLTLPANMPPRNPGLISLKADPPLLVVDQLQQQALAITIRVLSTGPLGSGFVIQKQGSVYTVVTNQHVLRGGKPPYRVQMPDGQIYVADVVTGVDLSGYDLALLQFRSPDLVYAVARLGRSASLSVGDEVFAAGFPAGQILSDPPTPPGRKHCAPTTCTRNLQDFAFRPGRVTLVLDRPLEDGYQIGASNNVEKGMSGGPLLNLRGEVVGINGMHAYPLWDATELYADGSEPCAPLQDFIARSSWAIPIQVLSEVFSQTVNNSFPLLLEDLQFPAIDASQHRYTPYFILQMQLAAEAAKSCIK